MSTRLKRSSDLFYHAILLLIGELSVIAALVVGALLSKGSVSLERDLYASMFAAAGAHSATKDSLCFGGTCIFSVWDDETLELAVRREFARTFKSHRATETPGWLIDEVARYVRHYSNDVEFIEAVRHNNVRYGHLIRQALDSAGLPDRLFYLAVLESWLYPDAVSRAGAVGIWQFMPSTAREMGLRIEKGIDERRDPIASTQAAIRYLAYLYSQFEDWALVAAAYNSGIGRVIRALEETGANNYWELVEKEALPFETMAYVPQMIAISIVAQDGGLLHDPLLDEAERQVAMAN